MELLGWISALQLRDPHGRLRPLEPCCKPPVALLLTASGMIDVRVSFDARIHIKYDPIQGSARLSYSSIALLAFSKCASGSHVASHSG